jgi:hypothetical protein
MITPELAMNPRPSCDVYDLFPNADDLIKETPKGYILEGDGIKLPFWAIASDPLTVQGCDMALTKFLDGSPVATRHRANRFIIANMCPKCHRDLDFIFKLMGQEGLIMHNRAHERDGFVEALKTIRDSSKESHTKGAINVLIKEMTR